VRRDLVKGPPARSLAVTEDGISFRESAWLELHARLALQTGLPPELEPARAAYARVFEKDDAGLLFAATARGLIPCESDGCADAILDPAGVAGPFERAMPWFVEHEWDERARLTWSALERAHAAFGVRARGVLSTAAKLLQATPGPIGIVTDAPPLSPLLPARGPCFSTAGNEDVQNARIVDCVTVRALLSGTNQCEDQRFFTIVAAFAAAVIVTHIDPRHVSVDHAAADSAEPEMMDFLRKEWHGEPISQLEQRWKGRANAPPGTDGH
jgi:hypothetical protein